MLTSDPSTRFKKDLRLMEKRGKNMWKINLVIGLLVNEVPLPVQYKQHPLHGEYEGTLECHIEGDWLMIYEIDEDEKNLFLLRTGTHSDLF
jgi:mRNA interferase YafQ